jgi:hypothetical protein
MLAHAVLAVLLSAAPAAAPDAKSVVSARTGESNAERTPHEWRTAVREALRHQATTRGAAQDAAVRELVALYGALAEPTPLTSREQLQLRTSIRSRLLRTSKQLAQQLARSAGEANDGAASDPAPLADPPVGQAILAQRAGNIPQPQAGARPAAAPGNNPPNIFFQNQGAALGAAGGGQTFAGQTAANAQQLIDLIQNAIAPSSWQVHGGQGTIVYFAPKQVLVIRQTDAIHDQIGQAMQGLRGN